MCIKFLSDLRTHLTVTRETLFIFFKAKHTLDSILYYSLRLGIKSGVQVWSLLRKIELKKMPTLKIISWGLLLGPVMQANERLKFEDDLRSEGLLYFTTQ